MQVSDDDTVIPSPSDVKATEAADTKQQQQSENQSTSAGDSGWMDTRNSKKREALPLDWTRVKRRRPGQKEDVEEDCCPAVVPVLDEAILQPYQTLVKGLGIICLHESDPTWFQGYFFPGQQMDDTENDITMSSATNQTPWGLLASQEELDDCLRCADGGYRRVSLTVFPFPHKRKENLKNIEWTGGDMMRLMGEHANLEPSKMISGARAVPYLEKLFGSLLRKVRASLGEEERETSSVLELLPEAVIISGPMKLIVSKKKESDDEQDG
mgnify:CR=1 FL=1